MYAEALFVTCIKLSVIKFKKAYRLLVVDSKK